MKRTYPAVCPEVVLFAEPLAPCTLFPEGKAGIVVIGGKAYRLAYLMDRGEIVGYRLQGHEAVYDLSADLSACDCLDALTRQRPGGCKHAAALRCVRPTGKVA